MQLIAVTNDCNYPINTKQIPKIGRFLSPDIEKIVALKPDLILGIGNPKSPQNMYLKKMGYRTIIFNTPDSISSVLAIITQIGAALNQGPAAKELIAKITSDIKSEALAEAKISAVYIISYPPLIVVGQNTFVNEIMKAAGLKNAVSAKAYPIITPEYLLSINPDVLILSRDCNTTLLTRDPVLRQSEAIKRHHFITDFNEDTVVRPSPRIHEGIKALKKEAKKNYDH